MITFHLRDAQMEDLMNSALNVRDIDLWTKVAPADMWKMQKAAIDRMVGTMFDPDRVRAFARIRGAAEEMKAPHE